MGVNKPPRSFRQTLGVWWKDKGRYTLRFYVDVCLVICIFILIFFGPLVLAKELNDNIYFFGYMWVPLLVIFAAIRHVNIQYKHYRDEYVEEDDLFKCAGPTCIDPECIVQCKYEDHSNMPEPTKLIEDES